MNTQSEHRPNDPLAAMLRRADADAPLPPVREGLAVAVRQASRRRHNRRLVATAAAIVVVAASVVAALRFSVDRSPNTLTAQSAPLPLTPLPPLESPAEYQRAKYEAAALATSADRLLAAERHRRRLAELAARAEDPAPTPTDRIASLRAAAALTLISQADRYKTRADSPLDALATYRRAADLFPDTPWVTVARRRIEELQSHMRNQEIPS